MGERTKPRKPNLKGRVPYDLTKQISEAIDLPSDFYMALQIGLLHHAGLKLLMTALRKRITLDSGKRLKEMFTAFSILEYILHRTLPFHKPIELIRHRELVEGDLLLGRFCIPVSRYTIVRTIQELVETPYLIEVRFHDSITQTRAYACNLYEIVTDLIDMWDEALEGTPTQKPKLKHVERGYDFLQAAWPILERLKPVFDFLSSPPSRFLSVPPRKAGKEDGKLLIKDVQGWLDAVQMKFIEYHASSYTEDVNKFELAYKRVMRPTARGIIEGTTRAEHDKHKKLT
jgi:hypothetical protein